MEEGKVIQQKAGDIIIQRINMQGINNKLVCFSKPVFPVF